jgi:hypothetical protein
MVHLEAARLTDVLAPKSAIVSPVTNEISLANNQIEPRRRSASAKAPSHVASSIFAPASAPLSLFSPTFQVLLSQSSCERSKLPTTLLCTSANDPQASLKHPSKHPPSIGARLPSSLLFQHRGIFSSTFVIPHPALSSCPDGSGARGWSPALSLPHQRRQSTLPHSGY